ncbi:CHAT domain-containing protein [Mucilaginibacter aquaedulcis]|uniref:CHAT domain-containing protein n=1 Tax=Mucilaginibacter aquaedulcis TaxID=1187081 RepID=UPI0025B4A363|nr:CHAT domain-containing protein [Mucilaginibacter aquaedulcis]MDN3548704.1 CHAT domain-containing protein [Mucilaginibacter aquaedulcis]
MAAKSIALAAPVQQPEYKILFARAEKFATADKPTDQTDQQALILYQQVISILSKTGTDAPFLLKACINTGAFLQVLNRPKEAITYFTKAFEVKNITLSIPDSAIFRPLIYCGNSYYQQDKLDSAEIFYNRAKVIAEKYPQINEVERLYNTLGVIAYSGGNYTKSIPYYERAISTLESRGNIENSLMVSYKSNLASAYRKLKRYNDALKLYQQALQLHEQTDKLLHNIGSVYLAMGESRLAISYLKQVNYQDQKKLNDLGKASLQLHDFNGALSYLKQAESINTQKNHDHKNSDHGITLKYLGDVLVAQKQMEQGLIYYQQSINNLLLDFQSNDIYANPDNFNTVFNSAELLDVLSSKAAALESLYTQNHRIKDLDAALKTYLSFYKLADHVERFYENDEARYLISNRKYALHQQPIDLCLQLYRLTHNKNYIEEAYRLDEENKASTLALYLEQSKLKVKSGISPMLLKQEIDLKANITRLTLQASGQTDSLALLKLKRTVNDEVIKLVSVQQQVNQQTGFSQFNSHSDNVSLISIQKIIPEQGAILSYHLSKQYVLCFVITKNTFNFFTSTTPADFQASVKSTYLLAQNKTGNNNKQMRAIGQSLYSKLIKQAEPFIKDKKDLMIIPDDELNYLPFELLINNKAKSLLKQFTITYNYSCTILLGNNAAQAKHPGSLGMAPFDEKIAGSEWASLPASKQEIEAMGGYLLFGPKATKQAFVDAAHQFGTIHLATHAYANDKNPDQSFIVFYPSSNNTDINYKLFQPEIYNLKLDKTRLVMLSACESGTGELVNGEGLMSLSRAFSYAGCNNIVASMWKADDNATAYIAKKFHTYLKKGFTITRALQQAKLDYLNDDHIPSTQKLPAYWTHMRLIGGFEKQHDHHRFIIYMLLIAAIFLIAMIIISRNRIKRNRTYNQG